VKRNPVLAGVLSLLVPGLGQIYAGEGRRGAAILAAAIIIGNFNLLFVLLFVLGFMGVIPDSGAAWGYWILRVGHDVTAFWSVVFWIWVVVDAVRLTRL
jgi:TM2 domain-containing membrane protein YozV